MGKSKSANPDAIRAVLRRIVLHAMLLLIVGGAGAWGYLRLRRHVAAITVPPDAPRVVMLKQPRWMDARLAEQIVSSVQPRQARSALDQDLLKEITQKLQGNPWVRKVNRVRRAFGQAAGDTIEVDCEYRAPMALVSVASPGRYDSFAEYSRHVREYVMVDIEGYRLPLRYDGPRPPDVMFASNGSVNLRVIDGVLAAPPKLAGQKWAGDDLAAGLELAGFLSGKAVVENAHRVWVWNYAGRRVANDAQLTLITKHGTEIRWGEPVKQKFYAELHPTEKVKRLGLIQREYGRIDAKHSWLDIRFPDVLFPRDEAPLATADR